MNTTTEPATTASDPEPSNDDLPEAELLLARFSQLLGRTRPRLFVIFGSFRTTTPGQEPEPLLGWGLDFSDDMGGIFYAWQTGATWRYRVFPMLIRDLRQVAEFELTWVNAE
jgi:hypothetical protein